MDILCKSKFQKDFKLQFGNVINVGSKTTVLGLFYFCSFLNICMLLSNLNKTNSFIQTSIKLWK